MTVIAIANQKGGVAKTTTAVNLAAGLARLNYPTLLIDFDSQASAALALGLDPAPATRRLLLGGETLAGLVIEARAALAVLRSDESLADVRDWLALKVVRQRGAMEALGVALAGHRYRFVVIDCGPGLDILTLNALVASEVVLMPVRVDFLSAAGTAQHLETIDGIQQVGSRTELRYVVPTFFDRRTRRSGEILDLLIETFGPLVTDPIRDNTRLAEAPHEGRTIWEHDPKSAGAEDYDKLVRRVLYDFG
jgi:chromosome partitioning protein